MSRLRRFALACLAIALPSMAGSAPGHRRLAHVEGQVGPLAFSMTEPAGKDEIIAALKDPNGHPPVVAFGSHQAGNRLGFAQFIPAPDGTAVLFSVELPPERVASLQPGTYALGDVTLDNVPYGSGEGSSTRCPDGNTGNGIVTITHFDKADPSRPAIPGIAGGAPLGLYQTHINRLRHDTASLTIKELDLASRFIEGEVNGEASRIVPKGGAEAYARKALDRGCDPGAFDILTESFSVKFQLRLAASWGH